MTLFAEEEMTDYEIYDGPPLVLRVPDVCEVLGGISERTLHRMTARGDFPKSRRITPKFSGWLLGDVESWLKDRPVAEPMVSGTAKRPGARARPQTVDEYREALEQAKQKHRERLARRRKTDLS